MAKNSAMLSGDALNELMAWTEKEADRLIDIYLEGVYQDGYAPGTEKPNELEELDMLIQGRPMRQMILAQPPDPAWEAVRSQAQQQEQ